MAGELAALGAAGTIVAGGVELEGDLATVARLNLRLQTASRVLVRLGELHARDFARLRRGAAELPWETVLPGDAEPDFAITTHRCRLFHTGAIAERLRGAIEDRLGPRGTGGGAPARFIVRGQDDRFLVSADSSGELLHRRGYRLDAAPAPLRETLAAGVLRLAGYTPETPLVDPTCGSGTFVIEAGLLATGRPPGAGRDFAFQAWPGCTPDLLEAILAEVPTRSAPAPLLGADLDAGAVENARRNAARAGIAATFVHGDAARLELPEGPAGLIVSNPPYGRRLRAAEAVYRALAALLGRRPGWRLAVLTPDARLARLCGRPERVIPLQNGGLRVGLFLFSRRGG